MKEQGPERILLAHGGGGILMRELIERIVGELNTSTEGGLQDSAIIDAPGDRLAFTTDSFVVSPLVFPGGDIGSLAVCGTVNDLAVCGATPLFISLSFIIEEGFELVELERIIRSIAMSAEEAGVKVVTGDTKVVERGKADGLFINTSGIGVVPEGIDISSANAKPDDVVILSGSIGEHGLAILSLREGIDFGSDLESDTAPLSDLIVPLLVECGGIRAMRDATRGGAAAVLNEIARDSDVCIRIREEGIPVSEAVRKGCELMGYDPLHIANEGKFIAVVAPEEAESILAFMRKHRLGSGAAVIGQVEREPEGIVILETPLGGERVVDLPYGDLLPRIC
jgi:hydrogenase expression/formation protein HypE